MPFDNGFRRLKSKKELKLEEYKNDSLTDSLIANTTDSFFFKVNKIFPYLELNGMFETKVGFEYETYNDINDNIFEWKKYNGTELRNNSHGLLELPFDLSDATLMGSSDHVLKMTEVISRF